MAHQSEHSDSQKSSPRKASQRMASASIGSGAALIALALYFLFRGPGPGGTGASGSGAGPESQPGTTMISTKPSTANSVNNAVAEPDAGSGGITGDNRQTPAGDTLTVLISDYDFFLEIPGNPNAIFRPTTLERIVELAPLTKGDSNGVRIRILRRQTARASAEENLKTELRRLGIHEDAVVMPREFVP